MTAKDYEIALELMKLRAARRRRRLLVGLAAWCTAIWSTLYLLFGLAVVEGSSMRPAYRHGDIVVYRRGLPQEPAYGDVVIVDTALHQKIIKRIAGKPGDVIDTDEKGHLTRNGEQIREPEVLFGIQEADTRVTFPYTVPEGMYFYLGDNRPVSLDSRILGAAAEKNIRGTVTGVVRFGK